MHPLFRLCIASLMLTVVAGCGWIQRPAGPAQLASSAELRQAYGLVMNEPAYFDKVNGAWYGKMIGLCLAQPVEGWTKDAIRQQAEKVHAYPVRGYFPKGFQTQCTQWLYGNFHGSPGNDDTDLMLLALLALRERGVNLTSRDIAEIWKKYPFTGCTAEGIALYNIQRGIWPPDCAKIDNPYQEWIGAQMRIDLWGMVAPGCPALAADYAERDSAVTHTGNGIYGGRFIAAAVSLAMFERDPEAILTRALAVIPADCEYAQAIRDVIVWHRQYPNWEDAWAQLDKKYAFHPDGTRDRQFTDPKYDIKNPRYQWSDQRLVAASLNGAACALALLYGQGDFANSICIAAMIGYDTDCNAGTVGAIAGAMAGESKIPAYWKDPLIDTYSSSLEPIGKAARISAIARETTLYGNQIICSRLIDQKER